MRVSSIVDHWRNRPSRERWLIGVPIVALAIALAWLGVLEPLTRASERLERSLPDVENRQARLRAQAADMRAHPISSAGAVAASGNSAATISVVQSAIDRHRLRGASPTVDRADDARVRIAFARVPFHGVWPLFDDLQAQYGVRVVAMRIDRIDASLARVEATLASGQAR